MGLLCNEGLAIKRSEFTYFYVEPDQVDGDKAFFSVDESRHIVKVGRMKVGDRIYATDGNGRAYELVIESAKPSRVAAVIRAVEETEPYPFRCALAVPLTTGQKLDLILEKATELGADKFLLFESDRAKSRGPSAKKVERLRRITIAAIKQSMRVVLPEIKYLGEFNSLLNQISVYDMTMFGDISDMARNVRQQIHDSNPKSLMIVVGPEAGFNEEETGALRAAEAIGVRIGDHRLRTETAAITLTGIAINELFSIYNM